MELNNNVPRHTQLFTYVLYILVSMIGSVSLTFRENNISFFNMIYIRFISVPFV